MIHTVLEYVRDMLNQHFKNEFPGSIVKVVLSNLENANGSEVDKTANSIVFFLFNVTEETTLKNNLNRSVSAGQSSLTKKQGAFHLNLQVMFYSNFMKGKYAEGLTYLSSLLRFFNTNKKMTPPQANDKKDNISNLTFELCKLDLDELSHLWSVIGGKFMPSLLYKVRILVFDEALITDLIPAIDKTESQT